MIKKVVLEKSKRVERKFPEFDPKKIYVYDGNFHLSKLDKDERSLFSWIPLERMDNEYSSPFTTFKEAIKRKIHPVFILDTKEDLARFIMGCREFPTVQEEVVEVPADDVEEVLIDDVDFYGKLYAFKNRVDGRIVQILKTNQKENNYFFCTDGKSIWNNVYQSECFKGLLNLLRKTYHGSDTIYQFDSQKELFEWSLTQVS